MSVKTKKLSFFQEELRDSISHFMAYVHKSVNEMSELYLANERRYNYTTPKSFLEQITLYQNLLAKKNTELQAKIVRLENGLEKLKSTASQVMCTILFNSLPNNNFLDWTIFKAFADDKLNVAKIMMYVFERVENIVGKGENAGYQHFLLFPQ